MLDFRWMNKIVPWMLRGNMNFGIFYYVVVKILRWMKKVERWMRRVAFLYTPLLDVKKAVIAHPWLGVMGDYFR